VANYYELLGVAATASTEEVKRAYRQKARQFHPDVNAGDVAAAERFREIARAYQVLSDPDLRARYDRYGESGVSGSAGPRLEDLFQGGGFADIFETFFGGTSPFGGGGGGRRRGPSGPPRGQDLEVVADVPFELAVFGGTIPVTLRLPQRCADCDGSGAGSGTKPVTCAECNGHGQVQRVRQSVLGQMVTTAACPRCGGLGEVIATPCATCRGDGRVTNEHTYQVDVPGGVDSGSTLRLTGRGAAGPRGGGTGDLYVHLRVADHDRYRRDGDDLVTDVPISMAQAALGTTVLLPTLDGDEELHVPAGTQPGREFVLRQRGVPRLQGRGRGDLKARLVVEIPTRLDADEADLLRSLAARRGEDVHPTDKGLFSRLKSAFS